MDINIILRGGWPCDTLRRTPCLPRSVLAENDNLYDCEETSRQSQMWSVLFPKGHHILQKCQCRKTEKAGEMLKEPNRDDK